MWWHLLYSGQSKWVKIISKFNPVWNLWPFQLIIRLKRVDKRFVNRTVWALFPNRCRIKFSFDSAVIYHSCGNTCSWRFCGRVQKFSLRIFCVRERVVTGCFQYFRVHFWYVGSFDQDVDLAVKKETEENSVLITPPQLTGPPLTTDSDCTPVLGSRHGHPDTYIPDRRPGQLLYFNFRKMKHAPG